ncbi:Hypothetical protein UVM_LOCUS331 [uncultured virus]|nr:Hypothetical protein UVM_LOCUS331 [uncultured virus]
MRECRHLDLPIVREKRRSLVSVCFFVYVNMNELPDELLIAIMDAAQNAGDQTRFSLCNVRFRRLFCVLVLRRIVDPRNMVLAAKHALTPLRTKFLDTWGWQMQARWTGRRAVQLEARCCGSAVNLLWRVTVSCSLLRGCGTKFEIETTVTFSKDLRDQTDDLGPLLGHVLLYALQEFERKFESRMRTQGPFPCSFWLPVHTTNRVFHFPASKALYPSQLVCDVIAQWKRTERREILPSAVCDEQ